MTRKEWTKVRTCVYNIGYHFIWTTKNKRKVLIGKVATAVEGLFYEIAHTKGFTIQHCRIMPNYVHLLVTAHPRISITNMARWLKGSSSRKLFLWHPELHRALWERRLWDPSYYVGTAGTVTKETVKKYTESQKTKKGIPRQEETKNE